METDQEKDMLDLFGVDNSSPFVGWFGDALSEAADKLYAAYKYEMTPALAFNEFVKAWDYYSIMPEPVREGCKDMIKILLEMWDDVAGAEAEYFYYLCDAVTRGEDAAEEPLSIVCIELLEAIATLNGNLPEANSILVAALNVLKSGLTNSASCAALLDILCARVWYRCLGLSCSEEEVLLSEGLKHHLSVGPGDIICSTELYALNMAAAIDDIICVRRDRGISPMEMLELAKEGYTVLDRFDTPNADAARQSLYNSSGISAEMALREERNEKCSLIRHQMWN